MPDPFLRSDRGMSNLAMFLAVDLVVWVEGGSGLVEPEDLDPNVARTPTYDTMFWQSIFSKFHRGTQIHVKSAGPKTTLSRIADSIVRGTLARSVVALDRDFDHARHRLIRHPNVLYTRGYSWENDVYTAETMKDLTSQFCLDRSQAPAIALEIERAFNDFHHHYKVLVRYDHALASYGHEICDRDRLERSVQIQTPQRPSISRATISALLKHVRSRSAAIRLSEPGKANPARDLHGHTIERYFFGLLQSILCDPLGLKVPNDACKRIAIAAFFRTSDWRTNGRRYYRPRVLRIAT